MNIRNTITKTKNRIDVDLDALDLNYIPDVTPAKWQPTIKLTPYAQKSKVYLDIETTGLDPERSKVIMVGLRDHQGTVTIFADSNEKVLLQRTINYLNVTKPDILIGHNVFNFDLPFLITRCKKHEINNNLKLGTQEKTISSSSFQGAPIRFIPVYFGNTQILDTFQQLCVWDKSANKLTSYNLKYAVLTLKLREDKRLELSNNQIQECYQKGNLETIKTYLAYDLEDTELLANFLIPIVYYQLKIVPNLFLQELAVASPALKAQKIHQALIKSESEPIADIPYQYEGGKVTIHNSGIHRNVAKIDVSSLYPSIMLKYGICSRKDPEHKFLGVLEYMTNERLKLKKLAKGGDLEADHQQNALKILINGSYGFLGTGGYSFNDYEAAALVTAYGRKILNLMEDLIKLNDGLLIESDTDGVIFSHPQPEPLFKGLSDGLPDGIKVELEYKNCVASVPKAKNYTILKPDGKIINKGAKRTDLPVVNDFKVDYLKAYAVSEDAAQGYYQGIVNDLKSGNYPLERLTITRKIAKSEKKLIEKGFGQAGDTVSFYYGLDFKNNPTEVTTGDYHKEYYVSKIRELLAEMIGKIEDNNEQLFLKF